MYWQSSFMVGFAGQDHSFSSLSGMSHALDSRVPPGEHSRPALRVPLPRSGGARCPAVLPAAGRVLCCRW